MRDTFEFNPYNMRLIKPSDIDAYFKYGFEEVAEETMYYTGTTTQFTKEQITSHVNSIVENSTRFDFLICENNKFIGEAVLMDIDDKRGHFRIGIFNKQNFSKGIGFSATQALLTFAFEELKLDVVELEVFPFNERGITLYNKLGFKLVERIEDDEAVEPYRSINVMQLRKKDYYS